MGGILFSVSLPKALVSIQADAMTTEEIHQKSEKVIMISLLKECKMQRKCSQNLGKITDMKYQP